MGRKKDLLKVIIDTFLVGYLEFAQQELSATAEVLYQSGNFPSIEDAGGNDRLRFEIE